MERIAVESSQIRSIGHDAVTDTLEVEFKTGAVYQYRGASRALFDGFLEAESKGRYFGQYIRGAFEYSRLPDKTKESSNETSPR